MKTDTSFNLNGPPFGTIENLGFVVCPADWKGQFFMHGRTKQQSKKKGIQLPFDGRRSNAH